MRSFRPTGRSMHAMQAFLVGFLLLVSFTYPAIAKTPIVMWLASQPAQVGTWAAEFQQRFNAANPDIDLHVEVYPNVTAQRDKLIVSIAGGIAPDIVYDSSNLMTQWYNTKVALPLDKYLKTWPALNDIVPDMLYALQFEGQTWGMPFSIWSTGDIYNMDVFVNAGVDRPKSWDEMIVAAKRMRRIGPDGKDQVIGYNSPSGSLNVAIHMQLAMEQLNSTIIDVNGRTAKLNTAEARRALTYLRDVAQAGGSTGSNNINPLINGTMGVFHTINGYRLVELNDAIHAGSANLEYHRCVGPQPGRDAIMGNGGVLFITQASRYPDQAWRVIQSFMERPNLKGYYLANSTVLPIRTSMFNDHDLLARPWAKELMAVLTPPIFSFGSRHPYNTDWRLESANVLNMAINNQMSIEEALLQAQNIINQIVAEKMGAK